MKGLRVLKPGLRTLGPQVQRLPGPADGYHHWYGHRAWRRRSAAHLAGEPLCRLCWALDQRYESATIADHIVPHRGDRVAFFTGELASLCKACHDSRKKVMEAQGDYSLPPPVLVPPRRPLIR